MHDIQIAPEIAARALAARGGRPTIVEAIDAARTAHLIIDMQNGFMGPGAIVEIATAREIVPTINRISRAVREAGGLNIFVQFVVERSSLQNWNVFYNGVFVPEFAEAMAEAFAPGSHGHALYPDLEVTEQDIRVDKARFGAFTPGTSTLKDELDARGIDTLIVTGTATNVCCETTAREAMQHNYRVLFISDATAAVTDVEHNAALNSLTSIFADVIPSETALQIISHRTT